MTEEPPALLDGMERVERRQLWTTSWLVQARA